MIGSGGGSSAGGSSGSAGGGAGGAGTASHDRVFSLTSHSRKQEDCSESETCSNGTCFRLTRELSVCSPTAQTPASQCSSATPFSVADECGCGGLTCAVGKTCVSVQLTCSCEPTSANVCVDTACASAADCGTGTVCTPTAYILPANTGPSVTALGVAGMGRCLTPTCTADADCTDGAGGRCALLLDTPDQAGDVRLVGVRCVYGGDATDPGSCAGTAAQPVDPQTSGYYTCPNLPR